MAVGLWSLGLLGALRLATETPDALCPTLAEVESMVVARLGDVTGGDYEARFRVVRGARDERDALHLELRDESGETVLARDLPVEPGACTDAAQALALILERYFEQLGAPAPVEPAEAEAGQVVSAAPAAADPAPRTAPREGGGEPSEWLVRILGGGGFLGGQGTGFVGAGAEVWLSRRWSLAGDTSWTTLERAEASGEQLVTSRSFWGFLSAQGWARQGAWAIGLGPSVGVQLEVASASGLLEGSSSAARGVLAAGGVGSLRFDLSAHWSLEAQVRLVALLGGASPRFVIDEVDGSSSEVLSPASSLFLGGAGPTYRF